MIFQDRVEAGQRLADRVAGLPLHRPLVLAVPRGGVIVGAALARALRAELDVVLARKLCLPNEPEVAIGAVDEDGRTHLNPLVAGDPESRGGWLAHDTRRLAAEIAQRQSLYRAVRPAAYISDRSVVLTDDGVATGATMFAAVQVVRDRRPRELIVAVPVAPADRLESLRRWCDRCICLYAPPEFAAIAQFYESFEAPDDRQVQDLLREAEVMQAAAAGHSRC